MLLIIPFILLGAICLLELQTIEKQKREIKAGEEAYKALAEKYRLIKNEEPKEITFSIDGDKLMNAYKNISYI